MSEAVNLLRAPVTANGMRRIKYRMRLLLRNNSELRWYHEMTNFRPFAVIAKGWKFCFIKQIRFIKVRNLQNKKVEQKEEENKMALIELRHVKKSFPVKRVKSRL